MKRMIAIAALFTGISVSAQTNTTIPDNGSTSALPTPGSLTSKFNADYPNNNPTWTMDGGYYRADYTDLSTRGDHYVTYDSDGNVIMRGEHIPSNQYPGDINDYYSKTYPKETYDVWTSEDKAGKKSYYVNRDNETVWFDSNGKYKSTTKTKTKSSTKKPSTNKN